MERNASAAKIFQKIKPSFSDETDEKYYKFLTPYAHAFVQKELSSTRTSVIANIQQGQASAPTISFVNGFALQAYFQIEDPCKYVPV